MTQLAALDAMEPLNYLQPTPDQVAIIRSHIPELTPSLIPAGTYPSLTEDYHTVGLYNFAVVDKDLPDDLVYKIVKAVFEHGKNWKAFIQRRRKPCRPMSTVTRSCRFTPVPCATTARSASTSRQRWLDRIDSPAR
jgi:TRAP-type uncharacterized transport system substrate-binding protein